MNSRTNTMWIPPLKSLKRPTKAFALLTILWIVLLFFITKEESIQLTLLRTQYIGEISLVDDFTNQILFNDQWKSGISLDFDLIISSINRTNASHITLHDCSICDRVSNNPKYSYKVTNSSRLEQEVQVVDYVDDVEPYFISCSNEFDSSFDLELPIGYPTFNPNKMGRWIHNFKHFCFTHSPGIEMDNTFINDKYAFHMGFRFKFYGHPHNTLADKYIVDLTPAQHDDTVTVRNMVFIASYFGGYAFQLFIGGVMTKMSMIYVLLINQLETYPNEFLNVSIISHLDIRNATEIKKHNSIHNWFWPRFIDHFNDRQRINITLIDTIDHVGWLKAINYTYYSSMFVMPHLTLQKPRKNRYDHYIYPRGILKPLQWMFEVDKTKNMKPNVILYYDRGDRIDRQRSIKNNKQVILTIKDWIDKQLNALQNDTMYQFKTFSHKDIDRDKELVSSAILHIGPHGGQFANLVFAKPNTFLFEFNDWSMKHARDNEMRSAYYAMAQAKSLHYYYLCPQDFDYQKNRTHPHKSLHMEVNIDHLDVVLFMIQQKMLNVA